ncbi:hypothetical protein AM493_01055 [Flavobacterium akiainvivens]|uniref:Uncharacterized protein n=1 Tax=Flavobacterium akiainvivens TaxID=1202724 RepID=A0A0M8MFN0_9FLAO|nr:hypothetical protein [Flavobacterium akiainvivens]KOS04787.1 hypothetical protein AM493_01055 [Flavobacterium akiainvivens]SFQ66266.1 hypothetical protein SAMN05444144_11310 [Flavobacterium akiainvivens]
MIAIIYSGTAIKLTNDFGSVIFDIEGFLIEFSYTVNQITKYYSYTKVSDFKKIHQDQYGRTLTSGFYDRQEFIKYYSGGENSPSISEMIYTHKFDIEKFRSVSDDSVNVNMVNFSVPYNFFYDRVEYSFAISATKNYSTLIVASRGTSYWKIIIPQDVVPEITPAATDQTNTPGQYFYIKNLGEFINQLQIDDIGKRILKKAGCLIVFRIRYIMRDILPILLANADFTMADVDALANNTDANLIIDPDNALKEIIFLIKKSWGYYYLPGSTLPHRMEIEPIFDEFSTFEDYEDYYNSLIAFYDKCLQHAHELQTWYTQQKYYYLLEVMSVSGLGILPLVIKKQLIDYFIDKDKTPENEEQMIAKLIASIPNTEADEVLDWLLECKNAKNTRFEIVFNRLDDARIERYPIINWIVDEKTNRMTFVYSVYRLWQHSKYSFYSTDGTLKSESFFKSNLDFYLKDDGTFKNPIVFEYSARCDELEERAIGDNWIDFEAKANLFNEFVVIKKIYHEYVRNNVGEDFEKPQNKYYSDGDSEIVPTELFDEYREWIEMNIHLYQSVVIYGHIGDDRIALPNQIAIPSFLFYYSEDFTRLIKIDAALAVIAGLAIEVVSFFTLGGLTQLKHLQYLKEITLINRAFLAPGVAGALAATTPVITWTTINLVSQAITITAGVFYNLGQYNALALPTEAERKAQQDINMVFIYILLGGAGASLISGYRATSLARAVLENTPGLISVPISIKNLFESLTGAELTAVSNFATKLQNLDEAADVIHLRYTTEYTYEVQVAFYRDFSRYTNENLQFWNSLNKVESLNNWKILWLRNLPDRTLTEFFTSSNMTNNLIRYYDISFSEEVLKNAVREGRVQFIKYFGDESGILFEKLTNSGRTFIQDFLGVDSAKRLIISNNRYFWLIDDLSINTIGELQNDLNKAAATVRQRGHVQWFVNPAQKANAERFLRLGQNWSNGQLVEIPAKEYLRNFIGSADDVYLSVDFRFIQSDGKVLSSIFQEIDGLIINGSTNKIETLISMKLDFDAHRIGRDFNKLNNYFKGMPDNGEDLRIFLASKPAFLRALTQPTIDQIVTAQIKYTSLRTGIEILDESPSAFRTKIKEIYNINIDGLKIDPPVLNTTRESLLESSYQSLKLKF